jgi:uncharacterized protein YbjT (DUF2867 family)
MNNNSTKTALVFGASGLIGKFLTEQLANDDRYGKVFIFVREKLPTVHPGVEQIIFNPSDLSTIDLKGSGNHVFCGIGTTRAKAGSKDAFFKVDHDLVERIAQYASRQNAESFVVVSSIGASPESGNFYLHTKGLMEQSIKTFRFNNISIMRPSMLLGIRSEGRFLEDIGKVFSKLTAPLLMGKFRKYRPIHAADVARVMRYAAFQEPGVHIYESDKIETIANEKQGKL